MMVTVDIPDTLAFAFKTKDGDLSRSMLEAMALEGYRRKLIGESQMRRLLGFETRMEVHGFLKEHGVHLNYAIEDLEHDIQESDRMIASRATEAAASRLPAG